MQRLYRHPLTPMIITSAIAGCVLTILAPFGTSGYSLLGRMAYWIGLCIAGGLGAAFFEASISRVKALSRWVGTRPWPVAIWQSIGAMVAVSAFAFPMHKPTRPPDIALSLFYIWVISMVICSFGAIHKQRHSEAASGNQSLPKSAPLLKRLKPKLRTATIYALTAEDHYVRIITSEGDDLVLMRLSDAITEMAPLAGLSPHRSWWVAEAGVDAIKRHDGKRTILLKNGQSVPISRNGTKSVRAAGWV